MLYFKSVTLTGFGSYIEETKFKLNRPGLNIVIGENGGGKTTAFSAIVWALFGTSLKNTKNVTTWKEYQPKGFLGTKVVLKFKKDNINYEVYRLKDYKGKLFDAKGKDRLILTVDGKPWNKSSKKKDVEAEIHRVIGFNYELFMNSVIFGQRMRRLIEASGPEKKRVFEEAFSAGFIQEALERAKEDLKDDTKELTELSHKVEILQEKANGLKTTIKRAKEYRENWEDLKKADIESLEEEIKELSLQERVIPSRVGLQNKIKKNEAILEEMNKGIEKLEDELHSGTKPLKEQRDNLLQQLGLVDASIEVTSKTVSKLKKPKPICPTCGSGMDPKKAAKLYTMEYRRLRDMGKDRKKVRLYLEATNESISKLETSIHNKIDNIRTEYHRVNSEISSFKNKIKNINNLIEENERTTSKIKRLEIKLEKLRESKPDQFDVSADKKKLKAVKADLDKYKPKVKKLTKSVENLKWLTGDMLSNKGLKAYIFNKMLQQLNEKLRYYEQFIGYRVEFAVDLDGSNKDIYAICYTGDISVYYEDLSGGEKQLVDAATAFALFDVISSTRPVNLLVFDEPFEGLTEENTEILSELIQQKSLGKSVYLVSHNVDLQQSSFKVIRIKKGKDGGTILKQL